MILLPAMLAGIVVAIARGGSLRHLAALPFRLGWLAVLCLMAQIYVIYLPANMVEVNRPLQAALLVGSSALLLLVVWVNRRLPAMPILGLGLLLNFTVMLANGGFMPVTRASTLAANTHGSQEVIPEGARLSRSKDVLLSPEHARLWFLADVIAIPPPVGRVYSVGDLIVGAGVFALLQVAMVPKRRMTLQKEQGTTTA